MSKNMQECEIYTKHIFSQQDSRFKIFYLPFHVYNYTHLGCSRINTYILTHNLIHIYWKQNATQKRETHKRI